MASLNIAEWTPDQVAEWLSGLGPSVERYVPGLRARGLAGARLLSLRCDDLEALGVHVIGHQELMLEAVEHLRNFQYEARRECPQQLALRVSVLAASLARSLAAERGARRDARLDTAALADVARTVRAVKPLVCWLDRWPLCGAGAALEGRCAALRALALEAATCAQRERFAEQPARCVALNAAATAALADYIIQDVCDPTILQPASLDTVTLQQGGKPLGFEVLPSFCGHHQLAHIRFGSPAHASGAVHEGDEIVQVSGRCVVGWSGAAVARLCGAARGELALRLRRRGARPVRPARPALPPRDRCELSLPRAEAPPAPAARAASPAASSSDDSEPLSPPASPTQLHPDHTRMYPPKPRWAVQRRHSVSGGSPLARRASLSIDQFWRELRLARARGSAAASPEPPRDPPALYRRDKAVSCSTGLELSPRPRTVCAAPRRARPPPAATPATPATAATPQHAADKSRGKLDKAHSTPAYDFEPPLEPGPLAAQTIPESPTTPAASPTAPATSEKAYQILDFKKSSSQIGEAILQQRSRRVVDERGGQDGEAAHQRGRRVVDDEFGNGESTDDSRLVETVNPVVVGERDGDQMSRSFTCSSDHDTKGYNPSTPMRTIQEDEAPPPPRRAPPSPPPRPPAPAAPASATPAARLPDYPALRAVPRQPDAPDTKPTVLQSPLKPTRPGHGSCSSLPLRPLTKLDIRVLAAAPRDLPPLNGEPDLDKRRPDVASPTHQGEAVQAARSPASGGMRNIFPSSKSRSLKKKNSLLAKRRCVAACALEARGAGGAGGVAGGADGRAGGAEGGAVWQRVRARHAMQPRWARRHLLLAHNLLYAYRSPECARADCMIYLEGFTASAAAEVKSRAHAFKVYHTGTAFYFACASRDAMLAWVQRLHRATLLPGLASPMELSKQFSETDYSETESDSENPSRRERDHKHDHKEKDKDKSKFGSLKKLTHRAARSESAENVSHAAASLDRKYLRFFSRHRAKDDPKPGKSKQTGVPVPTEHYRSYRRVAPASPPAPPAPPSPPAPAPPDEARGAGGRLPKPLNYIHASNPNLLDFEKSEWVARPAQLPRARRAPDDLAGFVTLEEFMLKKQEEERRQVYTNRVLMGIERDKKEASASGKKAAKELQERLDRVVPDVIYGELPAPDGPHGTHGRSAPAPGRGRGKPVSVKGKDGYEKIVYPSEMEQAEPPPPPRRRSPPPAPPAAAHALPALPALAGPDKWRDSLRRNDKVHSGAAAGGGGGGGGGGATPLKSAAQYTPLPLPAHHPLHVAGDSWGAGGCGAGVGGGVGGAGAGGGGGAGVSRLRLMFSGRSPSRDPPRQDSDGSGAPHYPHLQCPPTFQPETYSLARLAPPAPQPPAPHSPHAPAPSSTPSTPAAQPPPTPRRPADI